MLTIPKKLMKKRFLLSMIFFAITLAFLTSTQTFPNNISRPSLDLRPDEAEGCEKEFTIRIKNTAKKKKDIAKNVTVGWMIVEGKEYVESLIFTHPTAFPCLGDIPAGGFVDIKGVINTNDSWDVAPLNTEIKVRIFIKNEDNWPQHNEYQYTVSGKRAHYTLLQCNEFFQYSIDATEVKWRILKPGTYITPKGIGLYLKSNIKIKIEFKASNLEDSTLIESLWAVGNNLSEAESFGWKKDFEIFLNSAPSEGIAMKIWNKINVKEKNSACEYNGKFTITVYPLNKGGK